MASKNKSNIIVPESRAALAQMKYEIAAELGLSGAATDVEFASELGHLTSANNKHYWGHLTSRENGLIGGEMTKRLIRQAQKQNFI